jgi:hypothetical protein
MSTDLIFPSSGLPQLAPRMQRHVDRTLAADRKGGEALWEKALAVADARAEAEPGEWGVYLEATGQHERAAQRLIAIAARGRADERFRTAVISGWLSFSVAAITAKADDDLLIQLLDQPAPPTHAQVTALTARPDNVVGSLPPSPPDPHAPIVAEQTAELAEAAVHGIALASAAFPPAEWDEARRKARERGLKLWYNQNGPTFIIETGPGQRQAFDLAQWPAVLRLVDPDALPPEPVPSPLETLHEDLEAVANRQQAGIADHTDVAALSRAYTTLESLVAELDDQTYEGLAHQLSALRAWKPAPPERDALAELRERWRAAVGREHGDVARADLIHIADGQEPHYRLFAPRAFGFVVAPTLADVEAAVAWAEGLRTGEGHLPEAHEAPIGQFAAVPPRLMLLALRADRLDYKLGIERTTGGPEAWTYYLMPVLGGAGTLTIPTWRELERLIDRLEAGEAAPAEEAPPVDVAGAFVGIRAAAAAQEQTALPPTGAGGELYAAAERGPLAEILRLSAPALRLLSLIHFGGGRDDDDEAIREWIWESLTSDAQALDAADLRWAMEPAAEARKAAA